MLQAERAKFALPSCAFSGNRQIWVNLRPRKSKIWREINAVNLNFVLNADFAYGLTKTCETKIIDHPKWVRSQKQAKTAVPIKIAPRRGNKLIRPQPKLRLRAEQGWLAKTAQAAGARKRALNLPHQSGDA